MEPNKYHAFDGLTSEFYKCFLDDMEFLFFNCLKSIYNNKEMSVFFHND